MLNVILKSFSFNRNTKTVGITSLGLEHTSLLGNTIEEIAWQKAGIIKNASNVFTVNQTGNALSVIKDRAKEKNVSFKFLLTCSH